MHVCMTDGPEDRGLPGNLRRIGVFSGHDFPGDTLMYTPEGFEKGTKKEKKMLVPQ